jgi:hypothetical protein
MCQERKLLEEINFFGMYHCEQICEDCIKGGAMMDENKNYVPFMVAMAASKEGFLVKYHTEDGYTNSVFNYDFPIDENGMEQHSFRDLIEGKWTIEGKSKYSG